MSDETTKPAEEEKVAAATATEATKESAKASSKEAPAKDASAKDAAAGSEKGDAAEPEKKKEVTAEDLLKSDLDVSKIRRAKGSKNVTVGVVNVLATFNNTKVTFTDPRGNVISWSSAGKCNFRGSRKSTAYAAQVVTQDAGRVAMSHGMKEVVVKLNGPGMGRDSAVRALQSLGMIVTEIVDVTPVPHNGCRAPKRRRV
ncbi:MAG: 30S ribosomal protein S11 [Verrucomicrobia bacterium]|jgi:small subunit ribosomal protein S11|nr:30S ribosomal protein S11 [Verrucomicrobiota bacterium]